MTPEQLKKSREKWNAEWPPELRDKVADLIWTHQIRDEQPGSIRVDCDFRNKQDGSSIARYIFFIVNPLGKDVLFQTNTAIKSDLDGCGVDYDFVFSAEYVESETK